MTMKAFFSGDDTRSLLILSVIGSFFFSWLAYLSDPVLNRDGMLYIDLATEIAGGASLSSVAERFNWPFFSYFLAGLVKIGPFSALTTATLTTALFSAATTGLMVLLLARLSQAPGWLLLIFVLALPALNEYRSSVLRDWPAWCFSLLAIYSWFRFEDKSSVWWLLLCFVAIAFGVLCRLEVGAVAAGLALAGFFMSEKNWKNLAGLYAVPAVGVIGLLFFLGVGDSDAVGRIINYANALNIADRYQEFQKYGDLLADAVLNKFSDDYGGQILFWGLMTIIPSKLFMLFGVVMLAAPLRSVDWRGADRTTYMLLFYLWLVVLAAFLVTSLFLSSRYVVFAALMLLPFLWVRFSQAYLDGGAVFRRVSVTVLIASALTTSVSSTGHKKVALRDAGEWLASRSDRVVYINDGQVSFYAGQGYFSYHMEPVFPENVASGSLLVWRVNRDEQERLLASHRHRFSLEKVFDSDGGDVVVVLERQ